LEATRQETTEPAPETLRGLILFRIIIVSTLILSALLIQLTFSIELPLRPIYYLAALAYGHSLSALITFRRIGAEAHAALQIMGDLFVVTGLVYVSHGPDSGFTFLYLGVIAAGAILLGFRGGLVTAGLAAIFYGLLVDLTHFGILPIPDSGDIPPRIWSAAGLVGNVALNTSAFVATALLVAKVSTSLREAKQDLLRRKEEIARLQALHSSVLSSMSSGVITADRDGSVIFANHAAEELLKEPRGGLDGTHVLALGLLDASTWERLRSSDYDTQRYEASRVRTGTEQFFGTSVSPLRGSDGEVHGHILIFQNLTTLKRLEGEVRLKEKLAAVGELAAAIAHEIRNPLASISGSVQVLRSSAAPGTSDHRLMEIVVRESHRLSAILEDFLRYTRPREREVEQVDAAAALRDVVTLLSHSDELTASHRLETSIEPAAVRVLADPGQLRQVFWNLARNAVAAMPAGGTLRITARLAAGRWSASFADEGRGMSAEEKGRLFTPFAHAFPGGTGLGLAIVYRIVEEHSGSIRVDTEPGKGTTIVVDLPVARESAVPGGRNAV
jgi:two-component system sensor histidine kinase PilS (NtrC family)